MLFGKLIFKISLPQLAGPREVEECHCGEDRLGAVGECAGGAVEGEPRGELTQQRPHRHLLAAQLAR